VNAHTKSRLTLEPLRTLRSETKGQAGACPDRTLAIPCIVRAVTRGGEPAPHLGLITRFLHVVHEWSMDETAPNGGRAPGTTQGTERHTVDLSSCKAWRMGRAAAKCSNQTDLRSTLIDPT
jgi:hypothetical protein